MEGVLTVNITSNSRGITEFTLNWNGIEDNFTKKHSKKIYLIESTHISLLYQKQLTKSLGTKTRIKFE